MSSEEKKTDVEGSGISPGSVARLIDHVLESRDPAVVGLKRILRRKEEERDAFPLRPAALEEFAVPGKPVKIFSEEERHILSLEKRVAELQAELGNRKARAERAIQVAYAKGKEAGFREGHSAGSGESDTRYEATIDEVQRRISGILLDIEESKRSLFRDAEHLVLKLAFEMARKIVGREISIDREIVCSVLKRALDYIGDRERIVVRVAPEDLETVTGRREFWFPISERLSDITIEPDGRVEPGGCMIDSNSGMVDARLGVQFGELAGIIEKTWSDLASSPERDSDSDSEATEKAQAT